MDALSPSFLKDDTKSLFTHWKLGLTQWFKYLFFAYIFRSDLYLFLFKVLLKPEVIWSNFALSWVYKVTIGVKDFVSVIVNLLLPVELVMTQVDDHVKEE